LISFFPLQEEDLGEVVTLWGLCNLTRPWNDPERDIAFALNHPASTILIGKSENKIIAAAMVGHDGHRGALYYVAVHPDFQKQGIGKALIGAAEDWLKKQGVWKINILVRDDNIEVAEFYKSVGYVLNAVVSLGRKLD
jgi:ribosomal protein S18 acetylase RimI-like enzyme